MRFKVLEDNNIEYLVQRTKAKSMSFTFKRDGTVVVRIPYLYTKDLANVVVNKYLDKIIERVKKKKELVANYSNGEEFIYLGQKYKIMVVVSKHPKVIVIDNVLYLYTTKDDYKTKSKIINSWLIEKAEVIFNILLDKVFNQMKNELDQYPTLEIKKFKSVWGLCRIKKNTIALNIDLLHTDFECIEYVICHELCHFKYPNHQKEFHEMVNRYVDEKALKGRLKTYRFKK